MDTLGHGCLGIWITGDLSIWRHKYFERKIFGLCWGNLLAGTLRTLGETVGDRSSPVW